MNEEVYELINVEEDESDSETKWLTSECFLSNPARARRSGVVSILFEQRKGYLDLLGTSLFAFVLRSHGVE